MWALFCADDTVTDAGTINSSFEDEDILLDLKRALKEPAGLHNW